MPNCYRNPLFPLQLHFKIVFLIFLQPYHSHDSVFSDHLILFSFHHLDEHFLEFRQTLQLGIVVHTTRSTSAQFRAEPEEETVNAHIGYSVKVMLIGILFENMDTFRF